MSFKEMFILQILVSFLDPRRCFNINKDSKYKIIKQQRRWKTQVSIFIILMIVLNGVTRIVNSMAV